MKRIGWFILFSVIGLLYSAAHCQTNIDADNPNIQYVGRVSTTDVKNPEFNWPGVYVSAVFEGTSCSLRFQEFGQNYYDVFIDSYLAAIVQGSGAQTVYPVAQNLANSSHTVVMVKRTESGFNKCRFQGFVLDSGKTLLTPPSRPSRRMEFIGDSFTAGYGNEMSSGTTGSLPDKENNYLTYGPITSRYFNADYQVNAWSGMGAVRNYGDTNPVSAKPLPYYYENTLAGSEVNDWGFGWKPDAVSVYLGINDFSTLPNPSQQQFETGYYNFIKKIRSKYPGAQIFCVYDTNWGTPAEGYIMDVVSQLNTEGDAKVHDADLQMVYTPADRASDGHPSVSGHQKIANKLIAIIEPVMQWTNDTTPPAISAVATSSISVTGARITWTTSEAANSKVEYGLTTGYGSQTTVDASLVTNHTVNLTGLSQATLYHYRVKSADASGNSATGSDNTFMTLDVPPIDTTPPVTPGPAQVYPNPYKLSAGSAVTFSAQSAIREIKIYTLSGKLMKKLAIPAGSETITWDGSNESGEKIDRGIYLFSISEAGGETKKGKLAVLK